MEHQKDELRTIVLQSQEFPWQESLQERPNLLLRNICLLGPTSRNRRRYPDTVIREALGLFDGCKAYLNHPTPVPARPVECRDVRDLVGRYESPRIENGRLRADLRLLPQHADLVFSLAETMPESVGMSINARGRTALQDGEEIVQAITEVRSVDLVTDPAATRSLFESLPARSESVWWDDLDVQTLTERRPDLIEQLQEPLRVKLLEREAEVARQMRRADVQEALRRAGIPAESVSEVFLETLMEAHDAGHVRRLVEDRRTTLLKSGTVPTQSCEKTFGTRRLTDEEMYGAGRT